MQVLQGKNLLRIKETNQSAILRMIYYYGPISRSDIAQRLELTLPTITTNINKMLGEGLIKETFIRGKAPNPSGRRAHPLYINQQACYFGGVELKNTNWSVCVTDFGGRTLASAEGVCPDGDYDNFMWQIGRDFTACLAESGKKLEELCGIGISLPGLVDREKGILKINSRYRWIERDVCSDFARLTGYQGKITLENNAIARGLSAQLFNWDEVENGKSFAYLVVSAGIACPLFLNTSSYRGSVVDAGEAGHMVLDPHGRLCICGNHGCLEAYASEYAIINDCKKEMEQGRAGILREISKERQELTIGDIVQAQEAGDLDVCRIVENAIYMLGIAATNIINFAGPDIMLVDCQLFKNASNRQLFLDYTQSSRGNPVHFKYFKTTLSFVDSDRFIGALGAAAVAIDEKLEIVM